MECVDCVDIWEMAAAIGLGASGGAALVLLLNWWWGVQRDAMIMDLQRHWAQRNERERLKKLEKVRVRVQKSDR